MADFGNASFTRLTQDRLVIFAGGDRYVLTRDAAWSLADEKLAPKFTKWLEKSELPKDLGKLIQGLPKEREIPYLGTLNVADAGDAKKVTFGLETEPKTITLKAVQGGWRPDDAGKQTYTAMAKDLKISPSTLAVNLANSGDQMSEAEAWAKFLKRFQGHDFFVVVGNRQGVLWAKSDSIPVEPPKTHPSDRPKPTDNGAAQKPTDKAAASTIPSWIWIVVGVSLAGNAVLLFLLATRQKRPSDRFEVSHHERQLIEKARDEQRRLNVDPQSRAGAEELVIGKMIEAYDHYDKVNGERLELQTYKQFKEDFARFDAQAKQIKNESDQRQKEIQELSAQVRREKANQTDLQKELAQAKNTIASLESELRGNQELMDQVGLWQTDFEKRLQEMAGQLRDE